MGISPEKNLTANFLIIVAIISRRWGGSVFNPQNLRNVWGNFILEPAVDRVGATVMEWEAGNAALGVTIPGDG